ncbi:TPA: hypothetical protein NUW95_004906 [Escherichia coli]|nr:hypothetical protein [Escherichia coli]
MKQNTTPVVKIVNGVYTFTDLNPDALLFGLSEDGCYHLCLQLCDVVGRYQSRDFIREALNFCKSDPKIEEGWQAADHFVGELIWIGCNVKEDLKDLRKFLPNKADRRTVLWNEWPDTCSQLIFPDGDVSMDVEDTCYSGYYFDYDVDHEFSWTLNATAFFAWAYDYEVIHNI